MVFAIRPILACRRLVPWQSPTRFRSPPPKTWRIGRLLRRIGGRDVTWGAQQTLDVWVVEQRARLDQRMSERIRTASWVLVAATFGLVICTAGLIWATLAG